MQHPKPSVAITGQGHNRNLAVASLNKETSESWKSVCINPVFFYLNNFLRLPPLAGPVLSEFFDSCFIFVKSFSHLWFFSSPEPSNSILQRREMSLVYTTKLDKCHKMFTNQKELSINDTSWTASGSVQLKYSINILLPGHVLAGALWVDLSQPSVLWWVSR